MMQELLVGFGCFVAALLVFLGLTFLVMQAIDVTFRLFAPKDRTFDYQDDDMTDEPLAPSMCDDCPPPQHRDCWAWLSLLLLLAALLVVAAIASRACGAPVPVYRAPAPLAKRIEGGWNLAWSGSVGTCHLGRDGYWTARIGEATWYGSWSLKGETLTIRETCFSRPEAGETVYTITLADDPHKPGASGTIGTGGAFALTP